MPRVLLLSPGELYGGVERQIIDLCSVDRMSDGFHYVPAVLFRDGPLAKALTAAGRSPHVLEARGRYNPRLARMLSGVIASEGVQLIHAHGYKATVALSLVKWHDGSIPPIVKTEHGLTETGSRLTAAGLKNKINAWVERRAMRHLEPRVCYVTRDIHDRFDSAHGGLARHIVHNGIDPLDPEAFPRPHDFPANGRTLLMVGRLTHIKGIDYAIAAMAQGSMPADVTLLILGTGPDEPELKRSVAAAGVGERVSFLGFKANACAYIAHADALLMTSLHEGLPYTLLEAMSLGKPVVATRVGGLAEVLEDGVTGLLHPPSSPEATAATCRRLFDDDLLRARLGANAAREQRRHYTLETMAAAYGDVYRRALEGTAGS